MSFLLEMCPSKTLVSLCVEFRLTFPYFSCTLLLFFLKMGRTKEQSLKRNYEEASTSRTTARVEPPPPRQQVEPDARGTRVLRGLTNGQLALVDVYKLENLIGGTGIRIWRLGKSVAKKTAIEQSIRMERTDIYSGYLWVSCLRCVILKQ